MFSFVVWSIVSTLWNTHQRRNRSILRRGGGSMRITRRLGVQRTRVSSGQRDILGTEGRKMRERDPGMSVYQTIVLTHHLWPFLDALAPGPPRRHDINQSREYRSFLWMLWCSVRIAFCSEIVSRWSWLCGMSRSQLHESGEFHLLFELVVTLMSRQTSEQLRRFFSEKSFWLWMSKLAWLEPCIQSNYSSNSIFFRLLQVSELVFFRNFLSCLLQLCSIGRSLVVEFDAAMTCIRYLGPSPFLRTSSLIRSNLQFSPIQNLSSFESANIFKNRLLTSSHVSVIITL